MRIAKQRIEDLILISDTTADLLNKLERKKKAGEKEIGSYISKSKVGIDLLMIHLNQKRTDNNYSEVVLQLIGWLRLQQKH